MTNIEKIESLETLKKNIQLQYFSDNNYDFTNKTMYFGTGLASVGAPSLGFGVEILGTILASLWLKRNLGLDKVIHEISTIGYNIDEETRLKLIDKEKRIIDNLIKNLQIEDSYVLLFSHDYHKDKEFNEIFPSVEESLSIFKNTGAFETIGGYTALQITGMKYLYNKYDTRLKLGWITDKKEPLGEVTKEQAEKMIEIGHLNEYYFDNMYKFVFPKDDYSFLYTPCAIDFANGNRCVPYTVTEGQNRPVLGDSSIVDYCNGIPNGKGKNKIIRNWDLYIVSVFEELFEKIPVTNNDKNIETIEKVEYIKKKVLSN